VLVIILLALHLLSTIFWVGGMAFAYIVLRPAAGALPPPERLSLWRHVFARFFSLVWGAVLLLILSGYGMIFGPMGGFAGVGTHVHLMMVLGWIMFALFGHLYFAPWRRFRIAVDKGDFDSAAGRLNAIRLIVAINLTLGVAVAVIGSTGRYWG